MYSIKVLIVDDEPGMRRGAGRALVRRTFTAGNLETPFTCEIQEAGNGRQALDMLNSDGFDLMLLDYKLPDINGLEILDIIKSKKLSVVTIMMTAFASLPVAVSTMKHGAFDFLSKPFAPDELRRMVSKAASNIILSKQAKKLEEEKKQVRFEFISILSHELKAPISAIEGYLNILDKKMLGDDITKYESMVSRSLVRLNNMRKLIFDILDLTRIESHHKKREIVSADISKIADSCIETYTTQAKEKNITLNCSYDSNITFMADKAEVEIMFNNLISNAIKYNKEQGSVDIKIVQQENMLKISVSDTGIGLTDEEQNKLFGEFVRIKNEKTKNIEGSGLGLSILKKLAALYNGSINVESEYGKGTTFRIILYS